MKLLYTSAYYIMCMYVHCNAIDLNDLLSLYYIIYGISIAMAILRNDRCTASACDECTGYVSGTIEIFHYTTCQAIPKNCRKYEI